MNGGCCPLLSGIIPVYDDEEEVKGVGGVIPEPVTTSGAITSALIISTTSTTATTCIPPPPVVVNESGDSHWQLEQCSAASGKKQAGETQALPTVKTIQDLPPPISKHTCDLCGASYNCQFAFFTHLKVHYENNAASTNNVDLAGENDSRKKATVKKKKKKKKVTAFKTVEISSSNPKHEFQVKNDLVLSDKSSKSNSPKGPNSKKKVYSNTVKLKENPIPIIKVEETTVDIKPLVPNELLPEVCETVEAAYLDDADHDDDDEETEAMYLDSNICPSCDLQCETKESLDAHIAANHAEIFIFELFEDENSGVDSKKSSSSTVPSTKEPEKSSEVLKCQQCHRIFNHRNSLVYHTRSHTGERPYKCDTCGKRFFATSALKVHMRLHSGIKPYTCDICERDFRQWGDLKYHKVSIHSGERSYQCEFCGKDFARKYSLTVHRRIHTGERNYKCEFCQKGFRAASYLQNHRKIHTGVKPHACDICGKAFRVRSDMKRHKASHARDMKNLSDSIVNAMLVPEIPATFHAIVEQEIIPVISATEDTSVIQVTGTDLSLQQQQHIPVNIATASTADGTTVPFTSVYIYN